MPIQTTVNAALRSKLLSTFFRPAHTWRQYANSFGQKTLTKLWEQAAKLQRTANFLAATGLRTHRTQKKKIDVLKPELFFLNISCWVFFSFFFFAVKCFSTDRLQVCFSDPEQICASLGARIAESVVFWVRYHA